ncbi:N-acetylmuramoyl-L-alanine amidase [Virgibacillus kimchii]
MFNLHKFILVTMSALFILVVQLGMQTVKADDAVINANDLNIRSGPGTEYDSIGQTNTGETYPVLSQEGDWAEIQLENDTGWVAIEYITIEPGNDNSIEESNQSSVTIPRDNTQIRQAPSTESEIIHFAEEGSEYQVTGETEGWFELTDEDLHGYINKDLLEKSTAASAGFKDKTIVIDPGHGGRDVGAIGASGSYEKDFAFLTATELKQELKMLGANVLLARPDDEFISLGSRISFSNTMNTDVFISIHYNSVPELPDVTGIETYYFQEQNEKLASYIQTELIKATDANDRGTTNGNYLVIMQNVKPAVLLELGFISNEEKEELLGTIGYQRKIVSGIINGLGKYFAYE